MLPPPIPDEKPASWWQRNWKWFVPVGCAGGLVIAVGSLALLVAAIMGMMKSSDIYKQAVARAKSEPAVVEALGVPIEEGFFVMGNINISGSSGKADLAIPISGPKGKATVYVDASKIAGQWFMDSFVVQLEATDKRIDLPTGKKE